MLFTDRTESNHRYWTIDWNRMKCHRRLNELIETLLGNGICIMHSTEPHTVSNANPTSTECVTSPAKPSQQQQHSKEWVSERSRKRKREREQPEAILLRILYITLHLITLITLQTVIQSCCSICLHLIVIETWLAAWCPRRNVFILFNQKRHIIQYRSFRLIHTRPTKKICDNEFHEAIGQDPAIQY